MQILETGSRVAKGLEYSWKSWTNVGVLVSYLQEVCYFKKHSIVSKKNTSLQKQIIVQNLQFLKQSVPSDTRIFMYCIMINMKLVGMSDENTVLAGLQKMRGSVVSGYTVVGNTGRSNSMDSMERMIETVSREEDR